MTELISLVQATERVHLQDNGSTSSPSIASASSSGCSEDRIHGVSPFYTAFTTPDHDGQAMNPFDLALSKLPSNGFTPSFAHSVSSSSSTTRGSSTTSGEKADCVGELPSVTALERPRFGRNLAHTAPTQQLTTLSLPSPPPAIGLSELLAGSPLASPAESYFVDTHSEPSGSSRPSSSRRPPQSPFISYYGDLKPSYYKRQSSAEQDIALAANRHSPKGKEAHSSQIGPELPIHRTGTSRPRVRNDGHVLAAHGTFTSARGKRPAQGSSRSSVASSGSGSSGRSRPQFDPESMSRLDPEEREVLLRAAQSGDQLAMHRLGFRWEKVDNRYSLGSVADVWGPTSGAVPTRRNSASTTSDTRAQQGHSPFYKDNIATRDGRLSGNSQAIPPRHQRRSSDLFGDAANLALRASAAKNTRESLREPKHVSLPSRKV